MTFLRSNFSRFLPAGFAIAILVLALAFFLAYQKIQLLSTSLDLVNHTQVVRLELSQVNAKVQEATAIHRRFLTTQDSAFLPTLQQKETEISASFRLLDSLTQDNSIQGQRLDTLHQLVLTDLVLMKKVRWADIQKQTPVWTDNRAAMDSIRAQLRRMDQAEAALLVHRELNRDQSLRMVPLFAFLLLLLALSIAVLAYLRIRKDLQRSLKQLEINTENTKRIVQLNETLQHAEQISQAGNWQTNLRTGQRQYSHNVYRLIGYEPDSFSPNLKNWLPLVHPDDQHLVVNFAERTQQTRTDPAEIIFRVTRPDGQLRYFRAGGKVVTEMPGEQTLIGTIQDITEAHQLRQELEERILFTETLLDNLVDCVSAFDRDLRILTLNRAGESFFRLNKTAVLGRSIPELFPDILHRPEVLDKFQRALQGEWINFSAQAGIAGLDNMLDVFYIPLYRPDKEIFGVLAIARDVTESHRLRKELEERTRFAELVVESSVDMIAVYDQEMRYTVWNQRCVDLLDLKKEDVLGKSMLDVFPMLEGREILNTLRQALDGQATYTPPQQSIISHRYYESYLQPLRDDTGVVTGVLSVNHDVTESYRLRQELEERSRFAETIIESSVDMIITYDTGLRITAWNKKSEEVFQRTKAEVLGRHVEEVFPETITAERLHDLQMVLAGQSVQYSPHELSPFGIHANLYLRPLKDHAGQVTGVLSISHDVTDVLQSAAQLATLNASLEQKNQELANTNAELASFSYVASHDLQEPLRKIQAFGSRILATESERLSEPGKDAFRRMQSAADRMQQLIEDLLTYSRTNTSPGEFATIDLNNLLHEAEQEVSELVREAGAVIEAESLPQARVIPFQFRQLLTNLLSNALKYRQPGLAPHIRITCAQVAAQALPYPGATADAYFCIMVQDNGIGFEQQYAERIFELFQRLHGRSEYQGTGIGLAICRKIMQNHHGYLSAEGRPGAGATFSIYLPV